MNKHYTYAEWLDECNTYQDTYEKYFELQKENDKLNIAINNIKNEIEAYIDITINHLETCNEEINFELRNKCRAIREIKEDILFIIDREIKEINNEENN